EVSIDSRTRAPGSGPFRHGSASPIVHANFDQSLTPINSYTVGSAAGGQYVVRQGDTLASIAGNLCGDSSLWFRLAEANGLSGNAALIEGQSLIIPAGVMRSAHNASTFTPYDPTRIIGDTSPTSPVQPSPKKGGKCGVIGMIIMV